MLPSERFFNALNSESKPWDKLWGVVGSTMAFSVCKISTYLSRVLLSLFTALSTISGASPKGSKGTRSRIAPYCLLRRSSKLAYMPYQPERSSSYCFSSTLLCSSSCSFIFFSTVRCSSRRLHSLTFSLSMASSSSIRFSCTFSYSAIVSCKLSSFRLISKLSSWTCSTRSKGSQFHKVYQRFAYSFRPFWPQVPLGQRLVHGEHSRAPAALQLNFQRILIPSHHHRHLGQVPSFFTSPSFIKGSRYETRDASC